MFLESINSPADVKKLPETALDFLCLELRDQLVHSVAENGGHLAGNLGVVELTVAIHRVFDTSKDRLVFDVGHQSYVHKLLTGRKDQFSTLRRFGGLSGFPKPEESIHDAAIAGHASSSISVALGLARARTLNHEDHDVIAMIGDGALTGGMAYEALNDAGDSGEPLIVILNDNGLSITPNVGGMARYLAHQRMKPGYLRFKTIYRKVLTKIPGGKTLYRWNHNLKTAIKEAILHCSMFEEMGFQYLGPVDGHNIKKIEEALTLAKKLQQPVVVHVITQKGKGYKFAEENPGLYHGVSPFDPAIGIQPHADSSFSAAFGETLTELGRQNSRIAAITAAMTTGTGLTGFAAAHPKRFFDVGIAEGHAAAMAAGLAGGGMIPVAAVYSTFLQRAYDQILQDTAISHLHVIFAVDRAGLVGEDGETHHGLQDVAYLSGVPGMTIFAPASRAELTSMLKTAVEELSGPVAVRYPRGTDGEHYNGDAGTSSVVLRSGEDAVIVTYGVLVNEALSAADKLASEGIRVAVLKLSVICPLDMEPILSALKTSNKLIILEECIENGGIGQQIAAALAQSGVYAAVKLLNCGNRFMVQGTVKELRRLCGIDAEGVTSAVKMLLE